ncbi:MAG: XRE family transcriptional regulator [Thermodesulfobacteriota bacterium]
MMLGERISTARERKGLTLRRTAELAQISPSLLSQIENGKVDPSLATLRKIAVALDLPLFHFVLDDYNPSSKLVKRKQRRIVVFPKSGLKYELLHSDLQKKMGIMIGTLSPGGATSEIPLPHTGEECLVIIEGIMRAEVGEETVALEEGDSFYFDSAIPHRLWNPGNENCKFYLIITPPKF